MSFFLSSSLSLGYTVDVSKINQRKEGAMSKVLSEEKTRILAQVAEQSAAGYPWLDGVVE